MDVEFTICRCARDSDKPYARVVVQFNKPGWIHPMRMEIIKNKLMRVYMAHTQGSHSAPYYSYCQSRI